MKVLQFFGVLFTLCILTISCEDDPVNLMVSSIFANGNSFEDGMAVSIDLNSATTAQDVPINALSIEVTFDKAVNTGSVSSASVSLSDDQGNAIPITPSGSGNMVTISTDQVLTKGTFYTFSLSGLSADDGGGLTAITRSFTTEGRAPVIPPNADSQIAYWTFDKTGDDETGDFPASDIIAIEYQENRFNEGGSAAVFDGDESVIVIPGADRLLAEKDFTISFWMKTNSNGHVNADGNPEGHFVLGLGGFNGFQFEINVNDMAESTNCKFSQGYLTTDGSTTSEDAFFAGDGATFENGGWQGWDFQANLTGTGGVNSLLGDRWVQVVASYDSATKLHRLYFDGQLMKGHDFNLWPEGDLKRDVSGVTYIESGEVTPDLAFGFIHSPESTRWDDTPWGAYEVPTSKHFKGSLDDVRVFTTSFTPADVQALYDAEK